jgi:hypothetical protein
MSTPGLGSLPSEKDYRTITHEGTLAGAIREGGYDYNSADIENQRRVGICTAAAMVMNAQKVTGKKFSIDFQYLLQKKFVDQNWLEGSSIFSSMKVGKNYGFLPAELFTYVSESDRDLPYADYIAKLAAIPDTEITRLLSLCTNKLAGYAQVDVSDASYVQKAILDSKAGIVSRFVVGSNWWTPSWNPADIDPLTAPSVVVSGHAINDVKFVDDAFFLANSWSSLWNRNGVGTTHYANYRPTEAWIPYYDVASVMVTLPTAGEFRHNFLTQMSMSGTYIREVEYLQIALMISGFLPLIKREDLGFYGKKTADAVFEFQKTKTTLSVYERFILRGTKVGPKTLEALNLIYNRK